MHTIVLGKLGMEARPDEISLPYGHHFVVISGQFLDVFADPGNDGGADKNAGYGFSEALHGDFVFETVDLRAEGVPFDSDIEEVERVLGLAHDIVSHHDHAHARTPNGHAFFGSFF